MDADTSDQSGIVENPDTTSLLYQLNQLKAEHDASLAKMRPKQFAEKLSHLLRLHCHDEEE